MRLTLDKIASSTRNVGLHRSVVVGHPIPAEAGTVVAVRVLDDKAVYNTVEDVHGRMMTVHARDVVAGVLGERRALRGYSGVVPESVSAGDVLHLLNLGGVVGQCTSASPEVGPAARVEVLGAVLSFPELGRRVGEPCHIFPGPVATSETLDRLPPLVLIVGTCMHSGKTRAACSLIREATGRGLRVGAAKLTGVALRRDALEMEDHGAVVSFSFADAGVPATCGIDPRAVARGCLNAVAAHGVDLIVAELGDGLLGSYGVSDLLETAELRDAVGATVLAATDPVAAWGGIALLQEHGLPPVAITGPATDNDAGVRGDIPGLNARTNAAALADAVLSAVLS